jgi:hypothetical protein
VGEVDGEVVSREDHADEVDGVAEGTKGKGELVSSSVERNVR